MQNFRYLRVLIYFVEMKRYLLILAIAIATVFEVNAQSMRFGERIPNIDVDSELGNELELAQKEHVCLVFIHSESRPCLEAFSNIQLLGDVLTSAMDLVIITAEERGCERNFAYLLEGLEHTVAYDVDHRTFKAFGIQYVPCCVIYETKRNRTVWFGGIQQLNKETIKRIINK